MQAQLSPLRQEQQETLGAATSAVLLGNISWPEAAVGANNSNTRVLAWVREEEGELDLAINWCSNTVVREAKEEGEVRECNRMTRIEVEEDLGEDKEVVTRLTINSRCKTLIKATCIISHNLERIKWWLGISSLKSSTRGPKRFSNKIDKGVFRLVSEGLHSLKKCWIKDHKMMTQWWTWMTNHRIKRRIRSFQIA